MSAMRTALRWALLLAPCCACASTAPRIPFRGNSWHASVLGGKWAVNGFVPKADVLGLELVLDEPGTGGWAIEVGARYANGTGDGRRRVTDPATSTPTLLVDSERESDFYELSFGARQIYRRGARVQPYFGVGTAFQQTRNVEHFVQPELTPGAGDIPMVEHERSKFRPALYLRSGLLWNVLRDQFGEHTEVPLSLDVRGLIGAEYSTLELTLGFGFGR